MRTEYITLDLDSALSNASLTRLATTGCEILGGIFPPLVTWSFTPGAATASPKLCAGTPRQFDATCYNGMRDFGGNFPPVGHLEFHSRCCNGFAKTLRGNPRKAVAPQRREPPHLRGSAKQLLLNGGNLPPGLQSPTEGNPSSGLSHRTQLALQYSVLVCGVDEVGRGALFGPVVAAAVILPPSGLELVTDKIRDSKQLSSYRRLELAEKIWALAIDCTVGFASTAEIDRLNILQASLLAMKRAVFKLKVQPELCLVDGNQPIKNLPMPQQTLVKGDERSLVIASASIVAKVWRDALVVRLAAKYPMYDLVANKGYGTKRHLQALQQYGPSRLHRMSFRPCQVESVGE